MFSGHPQSWVSEQVEHGLGEAFSSGDGPRQTQEWVGQWGPMEEPADGSIRGWYPSTVTSRHSSPICKSGVHTLTQTSPPLFQVSMADLCLVPQVANAER